MNCDIYTCCVDFQKAFDEIQHQKTIQILKGTGMDDKDLKIIQNLYWNQAAMEYYGMEFWTLSKAVQKKIEALDM